MEVVIDSADGVIHNENKRGDRDAGFVKGGRFVNQYTFKMAAPEDTCAIRKIYEPYIKETVITFETEVPSLTEFAGRIESIRSDYPYIVCWLDHRIIGYAYAHRQMERAAYQWNAELSVYIQENSHQCGIGKRMYQALMEILKLQNIKNVYGGVTCPNIKSEKLHETLGFKRLGVYRRTGYKGGAWHDVVWFEKAIGEYEIPPEPFRSINDIAPERIEEILWRCAKAE